jgi:hypothetical protein
MLKINNLKIKLLLEKCEIRFLSSKSVISLTSDTTVLKVSNKWDIRGVTKVPRFVTGIRNQY